MRIILAALLTFTLSGCVTNNVNTEISLKKAGYLFRDNLYTNTNIITKGDLSTFQGIEFVKKTTIRWWDRRKQTASAFDKSTFKVFVFKAKFIKGNTIIIRVNAEFKTKNQAEEQAIKYAKSIGRLPNFLRTKNLKTITIHKGKARLGGGNNDLLIHINGFGENNNLEEVLMHEAGHTTLDPQWKGSVNRRQWNEAAKSDNKFISKYARQFPKREDIAETINWWIAVRCKSDRISAHHYKQIIKSIPNRLKYLDEQKFDTYPLVCK
tara:strand:- start:56 stop:853 length:798 start_codon:yes stop_codon:yes gene_type:complete